jgi:uncharacterized damage-inducible protein DinB
MENVIVELLNGKHAHADSRACVDVPFDVARNMPEGFTHSIRQLVWHMNYWMEYELKRIAGSPDPYPAHADESWPAASETFDVNQWQHEVARFGELLDELAMHAELPANERARPIQSNHESEAQHASSLEAVLWQTLVHNSYHLGQVVMLRQAVGAWPPIAGSDTW